MSTNRDPSPIRNPVKNKISLRLNRTIVPDTPLSSPDQQPIHQDGVGCDNDDYGNVDTRNSFDVTELVRSLSFHSPIDVEMIPTLLSGSPIREERRRKGRVTILSSDDESDDGRTSLQLPENGGLDSRHSASTVRHGQHHTVESLATTRGTADSSRSIASTSNNEGRSRKVAPDQSKSSHELDEHQRPASAAIEQFAPPEALEKIRNCAILDGKYFALCAKVSTTDHMEVSCQICPNKRTLIGSLKSTTNLLKHLKRSHPDIHEEYLEYKKTKRSTRRKRDSSTAETEPPAKRQRKNQDGNRQTKFEDKLLMFIIETMSPLTIIDQPSFRRLFDNTEDKLVSRRTITRRMEEMDQRRLKKTQDLLSEAQYICTTADIWSAKRRSFIGVTGHFIDDKFTRQSFPLACRRFEGTHSFDRIADELESIHSNMYGLSRSNTVATITDNASNFVKAFREFGVQLIGKMRLCPSEDETDEDALDESSDSDFEDVSPADFESTDVLPRLPQHLRCSTHTLNLIATTDVMNALKIHTRVLNRHSKTIEKCTQLWHKAALPKSAEIIAATVGHTFSYPIATRWNSLYDSLNQISKEKEALPLLCKNLDLKDAFTTIDISYIEEYCRVMEPMVRAVDILQGQDNVYYGILLPTLITLKHKLEKLSNENLKYGRALASACLSGLMTRFHEVLSFQSDATEAIIATISHPVFKLKWFAQANTQYKLRLPLEKMKDMFLDDAKSFDNSNPDINHGNDSGSISSFLMINCSSSQNVETDSETSGTLHYAPVDDAVRVQLLSYLGDKRTKFSMLADYPIVKLMFLKYNTPLTSSAPVERLFSFAGIANSPRRHALSDTNFERIVLLKSFLKTETPLE